MTRETNFFVLLTAQDLCMRGNETDTQKSARAETNAKNDTFMLGMADQTLCDLKLPVGIKFNGKLGGFVSGFDKVWPL